MSDEIKGPIVVPVANQTFSEFVAVPHTNVHPRTLHELNERTFPFNNNHFFMYDPIRMAGKEYLRCNEVYNQRTPGQTPMDAMQLMMRVIPGLERNDYPELVQLAIQLVRDMYDVPRTIDLQGMIQNLNQEEECEACEPMPEPSEEAKLRLQPEIEKRRILNSIVHGAAVYQWTSAYYIVQEQLDEINPELVPNYNRLSGLVNYWNWSFSAQEMFDMGMPPVMQGINKVEIKKKKITAKAMNFPVLIHELSKGVLDYLISHSIPADLPDNELDYLYKEADKYTHEQWHYIFGPTLWKSLLTAADVTSSELPPLIMKMSKMEYVDLANLCINVVCHTDTLGKKAMNALKKD